MSKLTLTVSPTDDLVPIDLGDQVMHSRLWEGTTANGATVYLLVFGIGHPAGSAIDPAILAEIAHGHALITAKIEAINAAHDAAHDGEAIH